MSPELAAMLGQSIVVERAGGEDGPDAFQEIVKSHLQEIYNTSTGRKLLESLHASGKQMTIQYPLQDGLNRALIPKDATSINNCFYQADGITPGAGQGLTVNYSPAREFLGGQEEWQSRPPAIGLAHELIHAEQAAYGRMRRGQAVNPGVVNKMDATKPTLTSILELETVGVPPHDDYHVTENKIRAEWAAPQPIRPRY
ncbi:M91 family zinc metallopeptidase [Hymenobacter glaciei]